MRITSEQKIITLCKMLDAMTSKDVRAYASEAGLCRLSYCLKELTLISSLEYEFLVKYLSANLPKKLAEYSWPRGEKAPRIAWLKEEIKKLKNYEEEIKKL